MNTRYAVAGIVTVGMLFSNAAYAWFFFIPIPNVSRPPQLSALIDALEKSEETKAVAYASEDKTFGRKMWVWGHHAGKMTQAEANQTAMARCEVSLVRAKGMTAGGQPLYDFGNKKCELYEFVNKTVALPPPPPPAPVVQPVAAEPPESPTARKLRELDELLKAGLINEQEYAEKRKTILADM
jgi:hypothetical protein